MRLQDIEFRTLRCFTVVAEELHFARAARRLNMSQPPLTRKIQSLETQLGVPLLVRSTRQVKLTEGGKVLLAEAYRILEQSKAMQLAVRHATSDKGGTLRVGFISNAFVSAIQPRLASLTAALGRVEYVWTESSTSEQVEALQKQELDVGFVQTPISHAGLQGILLKSERCMAALPQAHPLAARSALRLIDLKDEEFVLFHRDSGPGHYDRIVAACRSAGFSPNIRHHVRHFLTMLLLPASGCGISIVPSSAKRLAVQGVALVALKEADLRAEVTMLWNPENDSTVLQRLVKLLNS